MCASPSIYLDACVAGLGLGLRAAAAVASPAPAGGHGGGCGAPAAAAAQLAAGPADAGGAGGPGRAAGGNGVGGVGLDEEAVKGGRGALRHAGGLAGRVGLLRVPAVDHAALRDVDAGGAAHPSAGLPSAPARAPGRPAPASPRPPAVRGRAPRRWRRRPDRAPLGLSGRRSVGLGAAPPAEPPGAARVTPTFPSGPSFSLSGGARTHGTPRAPAAATLPTAAPQTRSPRLRPQLLSAGAAAQLDLAGFPRPQGHSATRLPAPLSLLSVRVRPPPSFSVARLPPRRPRSAAAAARAPLRPSAPPAVPRALPGRAECACRPAQPLGPLGAAAGTTPRRPPRSAVRGLFPSAQVPGPPSVAQTLFPKPGPKGGAAWGAPQ